MSTFTLDGKRLTDAEWLKMLADEEHAALEEQFYAFYPSPSSVPVSSQAQENESEGKGTEGEGSRFEQEAEESDWDDCDSAIGFYRQRAAIARSDAEHEPAEFAPFLTVRQAW